MYGFHVHEKLPEKSAEINKVGFPDLII